MADLTSAGVQVLDSWSDGGTNGKRFTVFKVSMIISGAGSGAASNKIPASALGLQSIAGVSSFMKSDGTVLLPASPNPAGNELILGGGASNAPASYSGTFTGIVQGVAL